MIDTRRLRIVFATLFVAALSAEPAHPQRPDSLDAIRRLLIDARFPEAETSGRALLAETEATSGRDSVQAARVIDVLVEALWRGGKFRVSETRTLAERSVRIKEQQLGSQHPDVGFSLTTLGIVLRLKGDYPAARSSFTRALAIQEQALGTEHPDVARTLTM